MKKTQMSTDVKGQAMVELAVFGAVLIMLLGVLVNYGLKYNFQQQVMQLNFRRTMRMMQVEPSGGYMLLTDHHIPSPENPFAVGSVYPTMSSASAVRDYQMHMTPDTKSDLPRTDMETPDGTIRPLYTAAFRDEEGVPETDLYDDYKDEESKYDYVYGSENAGWWILGEGPCLEDLICEPNPMTGIEECHCPEGKQSYDIRILDSVADFFDYQNLQTRCHKIAETGINVPWYCGQMDALFAFGNPSINPHDRGYGIQPDYTQTLSANNALQKSESPSGITTTDTFNWQIDTQQEIVYNDGVDGDGFTRGSANLRTEKLDTTIPNRIDTQTWQTSW